MASGIYKITNLVNNKVYIGSTNNLKRRRNEHFRHIDKVRGNSKLRNALKKYGLEKFIFEIIEETIELKSREQYYIDLIKPEYNIRTIAESNRGWKVSPKMRSHLKNIGFKKGHGSLFDRPKVYQVDEFGVFIRVWGSQLDAEKALNLNRGSISRVLSGEYKHTKGLFFTKILRS